MSPILFSPVSEWYVPFVPFTLTTVAVVTWMPSFFTHLLNCDWLLRFSCHQWSSIKSVCQHITNHSTTSSLLTIFLLVYDRWICHCTIMYNVSKSPVFEGCGYSIVINSLLLHNNIFSLTIIIHLILLLSTKILFVFIVALFDVSK